MACEDEVPEPTEDMEHFVHMHIDFSESNLADQSGNDSGIALGIVNMHVHGVPMTAFVETLLQLALNLVTEAMRSADDSPFKHLPDGEMKERLLDSMARGFIIDRIKKSESMSRVMHVPDDASELFNEGS